MKLKTKSRLAILTYLLGASSALAQTYPLEVYDYENGGGTSGGCLSDVRYRGNGIPSGLNNKIGSITLKKGYGVTLGVNWSCVGESRFYSAYYSDRTINVRGVFKNSISFIRVVALEQGGKKGHAGTNEEIIENTGASWFYNWTVNQDHDQFGLEYVPMKWNGSPTSCANYANSVSQEQFSHSLAFNEPDNENQANMTVSEALDSYEKLLQSGLRMGSPVMEQDGWKTWLNDFMIGAKDRGYRVDFIATHWYDYSGGNNFAGTNISRRFRSKMINQRALVGQGMPIWVTEYNANGGLATVDQTVDFVEDVVPWINNNNWFERHAWFGFGGNSELRGNTPVTQALLAQPDAQRTYGKGYWNNLGHRD